MAIASHSTFRTVLSGALTLLCIALAFGCGNGASDVGGSGGSLVTPADPRAAETAGTGAENRPPVIQSVLLDPREPQPGQPVRARVVAKDPDGDPIELVYSWQVNGKSVEGSGPEIVLGELRRHDKLSVSVVASDGRGKSDPKLAWANVGNRPPRILDLTIHTRGSRNGEGGEWVVEPIAEDPDGDLLEFDYTWRRGRQVIGEEESLSRTGWTRGDELTVTVTARDQDDASPAVESAPIVIGNSAPEIASKPPGLDRSGSFSYQIKASDPDGDRGLRYSLGEAPAGMEIDPFGGLVTWSASIEDEGEHKVEVVVDDRKGATTKQVFFLAVQASRGSSPASMR